MELTSAPASAAATPRGFHVAIDHVALHGFPPLHAGRVQEAFSGELSRLLAQAESSGIPWASADVDRMAAVKIKFTTTPTAAIAGRRIARAIFESLAPESKEVRR